MKISENSTMRNFMLLNSANVENYCAMRNLCKKFVEKDEADIALCLCGLKIIEHSAPNDSRLIAAYTKEDEAFLTVMVVKEESILFHSEQEEAYINLKKQINV